MTINDNELYKRTLYTKKARFIINEIHEYDIAKANISILLQGGYISAKEYNMYSQMNKLQREIAIGNLQKDPKYSRIISNGFENARKQLIESNGLTIDDIVSIKKDAFYVMKRLYNTQFGCINFTLRNSYNLFMICRGIEIYYGYNELNGIIVDIKGINDNKLYLHSAYLSAIGYILELVCKNYVNEAIQELISFMRAYDNRELDVDYYREFNSSSMIRIGNMGYGVTFIDEKDKDYYKDAIDISNNQMFNRELFGILTDIKFNK